MPQTDRYEKQFLQALKDIFVGATKEQLRLKLIDIDTYTI